MVKNSEKIKLSRGVSCYIQCYATEQGVRTSVIFEMAGVCVSLCLAPLSELEDSILNQQNGHANWKCAIEISHCEDIFSFGAASSTIEVPCTRMAFNKFCKTALDFCHQVRSC